MKESNYNILLVEDDELSRASLEARLKPYGSVDSFSSAMTAIKRCQLKKYDIAFIDLDLEKELSGLSILQELSETSTYSIVLSGREEDAVIFEAYKLGCKDFLSKPYNQLSLKNVLFRFEQTKINLLNDIKKILIDDGSYSENELCNVQRSILGSEPIFISGETGVGKTNLAKFIHQKMNPQSPFIHFNCAEISENLIESELFGHEKGSFTGAHFAKKGLLEAANGGVLFLDEIATLSLAAQGKLLKALDEKTFHPVGSEKMIHSNFRLISATCEDISEKIKQSSFRQDFYFRLIGHNIHLKSLRERYTDLSYIIDQLLKNQPRKISLSKEARQRLISYPWPGNMRELLKMIQLVSSVNSGIVTLSDVESFLDQYSSRSINNQSFKIDEDLILQKGLPLYIEMLESQIVEHFFKKNQNKVRKTIQDLKISSNAFYRTATNLKIEKNAKYE
jgi:DNA-binding NtrC family response regulator